jgi:hypothetical protein
MTHTVRTTMRPDQELEVDDSEYAQLKADGLLVEEAAAPEAPGATPAPPVKKTTTSGTTGTKES